MFCTQCGANAADGAHFCENCGSTLQAPGAVSGTSAAKTNRRAGTPKGQNQGQISQLKLQIRQLKLDLKRVNTDMSAIRAQYNQSSSFVPGGLLKRGYKDIEDARLWGLQKKKQDLQQQILYLEQQLLGLQQQTQ